MILEAEDLEVECVALGCRECSSVFRMALYNSCFPMSHLRNRASSLWSRLSTRPKAREVGVSPANPVAKRKHLVSRRPVLCQIYL